MEHVSRGLLTGHSSTCGSLLYFHTGGLGFKRGSSFPLLRNAEHLMVHLLHRTHADLPQTHPVAMGFVYACGFSL